MSIKKVSSNSQNVQPKIIYISPDGTFSRHGYMAVK